MKEKPQIQSELDGLYEFIYLDEQRAASLYSQLYQGLVVEEISELEKFEAASKTGGADLKLIKGDISKSTSVRTQKVNRSQLHHFLLVSVERKLKELNLLYEVDLTRDSKELLNDEMRSELLKTSFISITGKVAWEPIGELGNLARRTKEIIEALNALNKHNLEQNEEYKSSIEDDVQSIKLEKDRGKKSKLKMALKQKQNFVFNEIKLEALPDVLIKILTSFGENVYKDQLHVRLFEGNPIDDEIQEISFLRKQLLVHDTIEQIELDYTNYPDNLWTMLGIITAMPRKEIENDGEDVEERAEKESNFESSFVGIYQAFKEIRDSIRPIKYPRFVITPISLHRKFQIKTEIESDGK